MPNYELIIEPGRAEKNYWTDLWRYRELFQVLAWRDVAVRYKRTVTGIAWAIIRPFLAMIAARRRKNEYRGLDQYFEVLV